MKQVLIITLSLSSTFLFSQIQIGTTSTYSFNDFGINGPEVVKVERDTLISGINWKILDGIGGCGSSFRNTAINQIGSKVYLKDLPSGEETLLYDFEKEAGESYSIKIFGVQFEETVNIVSVDSISINGAKRKVWYIDSPNFGDYIIEGVGSNRYLVPQGNICDPHYGDLRCFSSGNEFLDFDIEHGCDESYFVLNTNSVKVGDKIEIYPNPVRGNMIQIKNDTKTKIEKIEIYNGLGQKLKQFVWDFGMPDSIEINGLGKGVFMAVIYLDGVKVVKKIVVE